MSRKRLLNTLDKSERNFKNILQNELERIAKIQNLSQLEQITRTKYLPRNELEQIAGIRRIKNYKKNFRRRIINCSFKIRAKPCRAL